MAHALPVLAYGLGPLASPAGVLAVLVVLAAVVFVGRILMALAWRLVVIGIIVVGTIYVLGLLGYSVGVL